MEDIIDYLCNKYGMSRTAMKAVTESPFRFISEEMKSGSFKNFNVIGLGKFALKTRYKNEELLNDFRRKYGIKDRRNPGGLEEPGVGEQGN